MYEYVFFYYPKLSASSRMKACTGMVCRIGLLLLWIGNYLEMLQAVNT